MSFNMPRWVWFIFWAIVVMGVCWVAKVNLTVHMGSNGVGANIERGSSK